MTTYLIKYEPGTDVHAVPPDEATPVVYEVSATYGEGPRGRSVLTGYGVPDVSTGQVGDLYLDLNLSMLYGPKTDTGWGTGDALTPAVKVGPVTTLTPGEPATVTVESSNDTATLSFGIPAGAPGDTVGPDGAVDDHLVVFDGTTGKLFKDGGAIPQVPSDVVTGPASAVAGHLAVFGSSPTGIVDGGAVPVDDSLVNSLAASATPDAIAVADAHGVTGRVFAVLIGPGYPGVLDTLTTFAAIAADSSAMAAVVASPTAMAAVIGSATAFAALLASPTGSTGVWSSAAASAAIWASLGPADDAAHWTVATPSDVPSAYTGGTALQISPDTTTGYSNARQMSIDLTGVSTLKIWMKYAGSNSEDLWVGASNVQHNGTSTTWTQYSYDVSAMTGPTLVKFGGSKGNVNYHYFYAGITLA